MPITRPRLPDIAPGDHDRLVAETFAALKSGDAGAALLAARAAGIAAAREDVSAQANPFDAALGGTEAECHEHWAWYRTTGIRAAQERRERGQGDLFTGARP